MRTNARVLLAALVSTSALAFPPTPTNTVIPGPPAAAPQLALTSSSNGVVCTQTLQQQGPNVWAFNPGNASFYYVLRPSHGTDPNLFPPIPAGHSYNPFGPVPNPTFAQADCGANTGPMSAKVYWQDWRCWPNTVKAGGGNCMTTAVICPPNSNATLVGNDCQCLNPAYPIEDAPARTCRPDPCTTLNCDDGRPCTVDSCSRDAGCSNVLDESACTCTGGTPPTLTFSGSTQVASPSLACPVVGGSFRTTVNASMSGSYQAAACGNACTSQASLTGGAGVTASLCSKDTLSVTGSLTGGVERAHLPTCSVATCGSGCGAGYCGTTTARGSVTAAQTRFMGVNLRQKIPGVALSLTCGGTLAASGSIVADTSERAPTGQAPPCVDCAQKSLTVTANARADLTCALNLKNRFASEELGCKKCLRADVTMVGTVADRAGSCGSQACAGLSSTVRARANFPPARAHFLWWSVETACDAFVDGCGELNGCGPCACGSGSCASLTAGMTCTVCTRSSLLGPCVSR